MNSVKKKVAQRAQGGNLDPEQLEQLQELASAFGLSVEEVLLRLQISEDFGEFSEAEPPPAEEVTRDRKRQQNREAEANRRNKAKRTGVSRRVRGFRKAPAGFLVETDPAPAPSLPWAKPTEEDLEMVNQLRGLLESARPLVPEEVTGPTEEFERKLRARRGMVPQGVLARVRAAHAAAFELPPSRRWERSLRDRVAYALRYILAGGKPESEVLARLLTGRGILASLKRHHGDWVPPNLTAAMITRALQSSTLTRGGSERQNVDRVVERLIAEVNAHSRI